MFESWRIESGIDPVRLLLDRYSMVTALLVQMTPHQVHASESVSHFSE